MSQDNRRVSMGFARAGWALALACIGVWPLVATADPLGAGDGALWQLGGRSTYQEGCFAPCMCPITLEMPTRGTFTVAHVGRNDQLVDEYVVRNVNWAVAAFGPMVHVVGSGRYRIGSPDPITLLQHRLELDLRVDGGDVQHFDSGWVPVSNMPGIHVTVSIGAMYCWDRVIRVDARPVERDRITPYNLTPDSTYQHGCFDPCDCILEGQRPLGGTFDLLALDPTTFDQTFAVLDARWHVASPDVNTTMSIVGSGVLRIGGDFAADHQLILHLSVGDGERMRFDSGVVLGATPFPRIDETVSINGIECLDTVLHVIADPKSGRQCGGFAGIPCESDGEFCKLPVGHCCCDFFGVCTPKPDGCPDVWDPVCGCDGVTYGNGCEADAVGVSIRHEGACDAKCKPAADGDGCSDAACSDIPEERCLGTVLELDVQTGAITTARCDCIDFNTCHVEFGDASPIAVGHCPDGEPCRVIGQDTNGDGKDDRFTAACDASGACCSDVGGSPLPVPICTHSTPDACAGAGRFLGVGSTCGEPQACCLPNVRGYCVHTDPRCCEAFGGEPQGFGSNCGDTSNAPMCSRACGGFAGDTCNDDEFCKYPEGVCSDAADHQGVCTPIPQGCPDVWAPVCGCDGVTYGNECEAEAAGVSILHHGPCGGGACCFPDGSCLDLEVDVCVAEGGAPLPGAKCELVDCAIIPTGACCLPNSAGTRVCREATRAACDAEGGAYQGDGSICPTDPATPCGVGCDVPCPDGQACISECGTIVSGVECPLFQTDSGALYVLGNADGLRIGDRTRITGCVDPECKSFCMQGDGCVRVRRSEPCGQVCGGFAGIPCDDANEFCKFPGGTCGDGDFPGACTPVPDSGCPEIYAPVCGCDGVTYGNGCEADAARMSVRREGECEDRDCVATRALSPPDGAPAYCPGVALKVRIGLSPPDDTDAIAVEDAPPVGWTVSQVSHEGTFDAVTGKVKWGPRFAPFPLELSYTVTPPGASPVPACFAGSVSVNGVNTRVCGDECAELSCCPHIAADRPRGSCDACPGGNCTDCSDEACDDARVSLCELTGYACAWMSGCNDDLAEMTRAAFIWRNGECYCWDDAMDNWYPAPCASDGSACCGSDGGVAAIDDASSGASLLLPRDRGSRSRDATRRGLAVSVTLHPPAGAATAALEIEVPHGWRARDISDNGAWDAVNGKVKWGPLFDELSRTVTFRLRRERTPGVKWNQRAARLGEITGTVSFDGANRPVTVE